MPISPAFARYAVYWAPDAKDVLRSFGEAWLGHDPATDGHAMARNRLGLPDEFVDRITAEPLRYGLHATLKAPFRLKSGVTQEHLAEAVQSLARRNSAFATPPLRLTCLDGFLALCPSAPSSQLDDLACDCVTGLDHLRAPLDAQELARRRPDRLSPAQRRLLDAWGDPYVLSEVRFHSTLTGRLTSEERDQVATVLGAATAQFCGTPFAVRSIALFGDPGGGEPFRLVQRFDLASA
mgnify:FL=1